MINAKEININVCDESLRIFIYEGFLNKGNAISSPLHSHDYAEIHFTVSGKCVLYTDKDELVSEAGTVTFIPRRVMHRLKAYETAASHNAFLIKSDASDVMQKKFPIEVLENLVNEIEEYNKSGYFGSAAISIAYICKDILRLDLKPSRLEDREFIIREFFANKYSDDITLKDLCEELNLSVKQTARLVEKYMGTSFSEVLLKHRMDAAQMLLKTDKSLTLSEIASMVGYNSYSGFWKAFKKYK